MYKEAKEVARQFKGEFDELLKRYKATMEVEEFSNNYPHSRIEPTIKVYIPADFREDGKRLSEYVEIDLGSHLSGYKIPDDR